METVSVSLSLSTIKPSLYYQAVTLLLKIFTREMFICQQFETNINLQYIYFPAGMKVSKFHAPQLNCYYTLVAPCKSQKLFISTILLHAMFYFTK